MSIKIMTNVWQYSKHKGSALLLLLAIADNASDSGYAFPGIDYLARKTRLSGRQVIRLVQKLKQTDELTVIKKKSHNEYVVNVWPPDLNGIRHCERCGALDVPEIDAGLHKHHKIPKSQGGTDSPENIEILCKDCHILHHKIEAKKLRDKMTRDKMTRDKMTQLGDIDVTSEVTHVSPEPSLTINEPSILNGSAKNPQTSSSGILNPVALATEICTICVLGETISKDKRQEVKDATITLHPENITQADLNSFKDWWYDNTWKGQRNQLPEPKDICNEWGRFKAARVINVPVTSNGDGGVYI